MGTCCAKQNQGMQANLAFYNKELKKMILETTSVNNNSPWQKRIAQSMSTINSSCLFSFQYENDINHLVGQASQKSRQPIIRHKQDQYEKEILDSVLIPENLEQNINKLPEQNIQPEINSFNSKAEKNPSFMIQFDTIFKPLLQQGPYKENIRLFLSWVALARRHLAMGFLVPLYNIMSEEMIDVINNNKENQITLKRLYLEITQFANLMETLYKQIYKFSKIQQSSKGKLFRKQNITHFVISTLFQTNNLMQILRSSLIKTESNHLSGFQMRMKLLQGKSFDYFNIPPKFQLTRSSFLGSSNSSISNVNSYQAAVNILQKLPFCKTPISKLKILLQAQKQIIKEINSHYSSLNQQIPEVDSDLIISLTMFIIVKSKIKELPIDLSIIQTFASDNALNSISGYYISTFNVAVSMIETFKDE